MSGFIPKEKLTAYQRWELAAFDEAVLEAAQPQPPPTPAPEEICAGEPEEPLEPVILPTAEDVERMYTEAHDSGYASGYTTGYEEGVVQARSEATQIHTLLGSLQQSMSALDQSVADQLLSLAIEIAGQVLRQSLRIKPELLLPVVREAVSTLAPHHGHPALFLHPDDAGLVRKHLGDQLANNSWRIIEDATVEAGGCRVEVGASEVDATLETRWRRVIEAIGVSRDWLGGAP